MSFNLDKDEVDKAVCIFAKRFRMYAHVVRAVPSMVFLAVRAYKREQGMGR